MLGFSQKYRTTKTFFLNHRILFYILTISSLLFFSFLVFIQPTFSSRDCTPLKGTKPFTIGFERVTDSSNIYTYEIVDEKFVHSHCKHVSPNFSYQNISLFSSTMKHLQDTPFFCSPWYATKEGVHVLIDGNFGDDSGAQVILEVVDEKTHEITRIEYKGGVADPVKMKEWSLFSLPEKGTAFRIVAIGDSFNAEPLTVSLPYTRNISVSTGLLAVAMLAGLILIFCFVFLFKLPGKLLIVYIFTILISFPSIYTSRPYTNPIRSDGGGYYIYLPSAFIDHDLSFKTRINEGKEHIQGMTYNSETEHFLNQYTVGTAIMQIPFFAAACLFTALTKVAPVDGYSYFFQVFNVISGYTYSLIGIFFLFKVLEKITSRNVAACIIGVTIFCTNYLMYTTYDAGFSHVYSFSLVSLFLYLMQLYDDQPTKRICYSVLTGIVFGLICMVRVTNAVIASGFFFYHIGSIRNVWKHLKANLRYYLIIAFLALTTFSPQMMMWKYSSGSLFAYSYTGQTFSWFSPHVTELLFSVKKGLLYWHPIWVVAVIAIPVSFRYAKPWFYRLLFVFPLHVYVSASWDIWTYGGSFGQRVFVDILPVLSVSISVLFRMLKTKVVNRSLLIGFLCAGVLIVGGRNTILHFGYISGNYHIGSPFFNQIIMSYPRFFQNVRNFLL